MHKGALEGGGRGAHQGTNGDRGGGGDGGVMLGLPDALFHASCMYHCRLHDSSVHHNTGKPRDTVIAIAMCSGGSASPSGWEIAGS